MSTEADPRDEFGNPAYTAHGNLVAGQVETVTVYTNWTGIEIVNRDQEAEIWVRFDGKDPVENGANTYVVIAARSFNTNLRGKTTLKLLCPENARYSVEGGVFNG